MQQFKIFQVQLLIISKLKECVLAEDEYKDYVNTIKPEIRQQLIEQQKFWKSKYNKTLGKIQSAVYDSMLKANKISSGTKNYSQVIELIIANEYENY